MAEITAAAAGMVPTSPAPLAPSGLSGDGVCWYCVSNGYIEDEIVHAFGGTYEGPVAPDPAEVAEWKWMPFTALAEDLTRRPELYTIWLRHYFREHYDAIAAWMENG